jgi:hypothetical protein
MQDLCPTCSALRNDWIQAVRRWRALERSIADVRHKEAARLDQERRFEAFIQRQRTCKDCSRSEA